jgi:general secretion pathway protein D
MKKPLFILISLFYVYAGIVFAEEVPPTTDVPAAVQSEQTQRKRAPVPPRPGIPSKENAPSGSVSPSQIKAFLSKPQEENYIILNFDNADLKDVISTVASITNENFIITPGVDARITIYSSKKIPVSEVMNVFESVLEVNGMALVRSGDFFKVVSGSSAKQKPVPVRSRNQMGSLVVVDRIVTQIVPVNYIPASEASTVLTPMLSQFGSITPNPRNNLLIISDLSSNIIRHLHILKEIDVNAFKNTRMFFFKPQFSDVLTLSNELTEVLNALNLAGEGLVVIPIERINSLVVFSASSVLLKTVEGWIKKLDEEVEAGQNVFVHPIQNVKAEEVAEILKTLYEVTDSGSPRIISQKKQPAAGKKAKTRRPTARRRSTKSDSTGSRVEVLTFEPTNSLVILAPPGIYKEMVNTIKKIDIYPREVLIEAVIAEVSLSDSDEHGIQWSVLHNINVENKDYTGLVRSGSGSPVSAFLSEAPTLATAASGGFSYFVFRPDKLVALIRAIAGESKVNILSSPRLLVRDQEEASIEVGSEIPTATSTTSTTTTDTLTQNIEYRTVGIKLKIKPTISEEKTVVLDIEQEVSNLGEDQQVGQTGNLFPTFDTTNTKTSIVVPNEQGIIIGGIMEENREKSYQGIPLLSKIPLLGALFRYNVNAVTKKELIIIITPHVLADRSEADVITKDFMGQLRELKEFLISKENEVNIPSFNLSDLPEK